MSAGLGRRLHGLRSWRPRPGYPAGTGPVSRPAATTGAGTATTAAALTVTLGPPAACWAVAVWQMNRMDMGSGDQSRAVRRVCRRVDGDDGGNDATGRSPGSIRRVQAGGVHAAPVFVVGEVAGVADRPLPW